MQQIHHKIYTYTRSPQNQKDDLNLLSGRCGLLGHLVLLCASFCSTFRSLPTLCIWYTFDPWLQTPIRWRSQTTCSTHQALCCIEGHLLRKAALVHVSSLKYKAILSVWSWLQETVTGNGDALCHQECHFRSFIWTDFPFYSLWESPFLCITEMMCERWRESAAVSCSSLRLQGGISSRLSHPPRKPPPSLNKIPRGGSNELIWLLIHLFAVQTCLNSAYNKSSKG